MPITEKYKLALELAPVAMLLIDADGCIQIANSELTEMFEYAAEDLLGQRVELLVPQEIRHLHPKLRAAFQHVPAKRKMGKGRDLQGLTRSGKLLPLDLGLQPIDVEGEIWTLVTAIDTTNRIRSEALVRAALDAAASAMVMVDHKGAIVSVNKAALELFQYAEHELLDADVEILVPVDLQDAHRVYRQSFFELSAQRAMGKGTQLYGRNKSGEEFRIEAALTPVEIGGEHLVLATIIDLSDRIAAERILAEKQAAEALADRLTRMNDDLNQFTYSASHDLKAPMSTMAGMLSLCLADLKAGDVEEVATNLKKLQALAVSSAQKVESLLKLSQVGHDDAAREQIDITALASDVWSRITLAEDTPPDFQISLEVDAPFVSVPESVEIILENLLKNAANYRDEGKSKQWVRLDARQDRDWIDISVSDNGIGLDADACERVFSMFARFSDRSGHGLGLAIARRQVDQLGGRITCSSEEGVGTKFEMRLPIKSA